ncbi:MAG: hypothetical protein ACJ798_04950, partial [Phenylobacterium sp.]
MFRKSAADDSSPGGGGPLLSLSEQATLANAPKRRPLSGWSAVGDLVGKIWNGPNTVLGAVYGGVGHAV